MIAGGGTAGIIAAVAAAKNGARTLLLERGGFLGGHIATQLLEHSAGWFDAGGARIVGGLADELVERLAVDGGTDGHVRDDTGYTRYRLPVDHEVFKSTVTRWMAEEKVEFLTYAPVVGTVERGEEWYLICESKSGRLAFRTRTAVDATGDADLCVNAGCPFLSEVGSATQPVSLLFKLGGVDHARLLDYVEQRPDSFKMGVQPSELRNRPHINLWGFTALLQRGFEEGGLSLERNELHYAGDVRTGQGVINVTRFAADATDAFELARAEVALRKQVLEFARFFRELVPGFERSFLASTASCVGVRESRRIRGIATLTDADVRSGRTSADGVARGGFPIDSHDPTGKSMDGTEQLPSGYDIPFGALVPAAGPNIIVAGRCISAERKALASARITGTCMAMGQAAGTAAALSAATGVALRSLDVSVLRRTLLDQGAIIGGTPQSHHQGRGQV